ncbi:response regulator [Pseudoalteromonas tunicata]|uniref:response regulator n=1 Tax=Pseudoalteromonas tunicata TaxID=314281 RepID=UPI00273F79A3|nr:response regulator [Pseudoalteromonas tunicata]MDP4982450.1 diguanylate cyclase [Pseudoalteromonas tunicata]
MPNKLLIIEDNSSIAKVQKHIALKLGFEVDLAYSLGEAIALIEENDYFCAVVDYVLPDANDGEAIPFTIGAEIPTIVMTGKLDNQTRDTVLRYPIVDYITKEIRQSYNYLETQLRRLPKNQAVRILIVDDSPATRKHLSNLLQRHKYKVALACDGLEALEQLNIYPDIKVVICDNEMPNMDGITLTAKIRQTYSNEELAVIGISSSKDNQISAKFLKSGANDYISKPFYPEEFYCRLSQNIEMLDAIATIRLQANSDYLTNLPNRRYFFEQTQLNIEKNVQAQHSTILAMIDIDFFKAINDNYGHDAGDEVLKGLANHFRLHFSEHLIARLGGEEFAVYFKQSTSAEASQQLEAFRMSVELNSPSFSSKKIPFTLSIGLADSNETNVDAILKIADQYLYQAKSDGRNRLITA